MENIIQLILWVIILGSIYWVIDWGRKRLGLPEPFNNILEWVLIIGIVVFAINLILTLVGQPIFDMPNLNLG